MNPWVFLAVALPLELVAIFLVSYRLGAHWNGGPKWPWSARNQDRGPDA